MLSLVYASSASEEFSKADLIELLRKSRENNERLGITGMLLYKDGNIIQVLEGPDDAVRQLFRIIDGDDRHGGVIPLLEQQIEQRQFPDWSMGFRDLNDGSLREMPGYSDFMNEPLNSITFQRDPNRARKLLDSFRQMMDR